MDAVTYMKNFNSVASNLDLNSFENGIEVVRNTWEQGNNIITLGNGGSSMTALHFNTDWTKMIYMATGKPFYGRSLVDNMGLIMAYANDVSFADVFSEQLKNVLRPNDLVIAISGSGNSENVIRAIDYANDNQAVTLGLSGYDGGRLKTKSQHSIWVNSYDMQIVEDCHSMFGHMVMQSLTK